MLFSPQTGSEKVATVLGGLTEMDGSTEMGGCFACVEDRVYRPCLGREREQEHAKPSLASWQANASRQIRGSQAVTLECSDQNAASTVFPILVRATEH